MQTIKSDQMKIGVYCPTRKRVASLARLIESIVNNADYPERVTFRFYVDTDDIQTIDFLNDLKKYPVQYSAIIEEHNTRPLSDTYNILFENSDDDVMMQFGDDTIMRTKGWDTLIQSAFQKYDDRLILVYGRDGIHNEGFAPHYALHRKWIEAVGYASPPYFTADWSDTWTFEIAKSIGRTLFIDELVIEHMHWTQGKMQFDETSQIGENRRRSFDNEGLFRSEKMVKEREIASIKLREKINNV